MNSLLWKVKPGRIVFTLLLLLFTAGLSAQTLAIKSNVPYLATGNLNLGMEVGLSPKLTLNVNYGINPFVFGDNKKWRHWMVQPEIRYWFCERFYGHFMGLHVGAGEYNLNKIKIPTVKDAQKYRFEGWGALGGLSYGYSWILGGRWNIEASLGLGVVYTEFKEYDCPTCGKLLKSNDNLFLSPTKAGITIIHLIK